MNVKFIKTLVLFFILCISFSTNSYAASWKKTRDLVMSLRENGNCSQAYSLANQYNNLDEYYVDSQFISGWIALRCLNQPNIASNNFINMTRALSFIKDTNKSRIKSMIGYWLGRSLEASNHEKESKEAYLAASKFPTTFYGQLSIARMGEEFPINKINKDNYPVIDFFWQDNRIHKAYVLATIKVESSFKINSISSAGAKGLMQVMESTAKTIVNNEGFNLDKNRIKSDVNYNIAIGSKYLGDQYSYFNGNAMLSSAAYNAGPSRVDNWIDRFGDPRRGANYAIDFVESIPYSETREYVKNVISSYVIYLSLLNK